MGERIVEARELARLLAHLVRALPILRTQRLKLRRALPCRLEVLGVRGIQVAPELIDKPLELCSRRIGRGIREGCARGVWEGSLGGEFGRGVWEGSLGGEVGRQVDSDQWEQMGCDELSVMRALQACSLVKFGREIGNS